MKTLTPTNRHSSTLPPTPTHSHPPTHLVAGVEARAGHLCLGKKAVEVLGSVFNHQTGLPDSRFLLLRLRLLRLLFHARQVDWQRLLLVDNHTQAGQGSFKTTSSQTSPSYFDVNGPLIKNQPSFKTTFSQTPPFLFWCQWTPYQEPTLLYLPSYCHANGPLTKDYSFLRHFPPQKKNPFPLF